LGTSTIDDNLVRHLDSIHPFGLKAARASHCG
jgi:hypothetical protein